MSNARKLADNLPTDGQLGNRNAIINGMFNCWQRGTSFSASGYGADRWTYGTSGGAGVHSRRSHSVADQTTFNTPYYHRLAVSSGNNNQGMSQNIEDITRFAGKTITVSFYLKGTNPAGGSFATILGGYMGSGGSGDWELTHADAITVTSSWQRFTREFTCPENTGRTIGDNHYLYFYPARQPTADNGTAAWTLDMANVQLEIGSQSTPFEQEPLGVTLHKCQRYYHNSFHKGKTPGVDTDNANQVIVTSWNDGNCHFPPFPVVMRGVPTITLRSRNTTNTGKVTQDSSEKSASVTGIGVKGGEYIAITGGSPAKWTAFSYECDAEL